MEFKQGDKITGDKFFRLDVKGKNFSTNERIKDAVANLDMDFSDACIGKYNNFDNNDFGYSFDKDNEIVTFYLNPKVYLHCTNEVKRETRKMQLLKLKSKLLEEYSILSSLVIEEEETLSC